MRLSLLLLLAACGDPVPAPSAPPPAPEAPAEAPPAPVTAPLDGAPATVIFVVMDTVRADHTSLCGHDRPTTPTLAALAEKGVHSCRTYAPAPWTLPSHASYFTGVPVTEHAAQFVVGSEVELNRNIRVRPLDAHFRTLAEHFADAGYQTALVSGNTIIKAESGLTQGFEFHDTSVVSEGGLRKGKLAQAVARTLEPLDRDRPLFLFVNIFDAHDPYPAIPEGVDWVPAREAVKFRANKAEDDNPFYRYIRGMMSEEEAAPWLAQITDLYDYGIHHADKSLGKVLEVLDEQGWTDRPYRLVVTSDHGEFLGEHSLLRHGGFLWEPVTRVPLVMVDTSSPPPTLPEPFSGIHVFDLVRDGRLPETLLPPQAVSERDPDNIKVGAVGCAVWGGDDKIIWTEGTSERFDLAADPAEATPLPVGDHPLAPVVERVSEATLEASKRPAPSADEMMEALKAAGYVE